MGERSLGKKAGLWQCVSEMGDSRAELLLMDGAEWSVCRNGRSWELLKYRSPSDPRGNRSLAETPSLTPQIFSPTPSANHSPAGETHIDTRDRTKKSKVKGKWDIKLLIS